MAKTKKRKKETFKLWPLLVLAALAAGFFWVFQGNPPAQTPTQPPTQEIQQTFPPKPAASPYTPSDFQLEDGFLACGGRETVLGIDVSHHQGQVDWLRVKEAGIRFVMVRLGHRSYGDGKLYADRLVQENLAGAREAGLLVGAYFYSQATNVRQAEAEAAYALEILGDFRLDLPLVCDWEITDRTEPVSKRVATDCIVAFCRYIASKDVETMVYFNSYQAESRLELERLEQYGWWLAMYDHSKDFPCRFDMWQYTQSGTVAGIENNVDINVIVLEDSTLAELF